MVFDIVGIYESNDENNNHTLHITSDNKSNGTFIATFTTKNTPKGEITYIIDNGINGSSKWMYTKGERNAGIAFMVNKRSDDASYVLSDCWAGSITGAGALLMSGSRAYSTSDGKGLVYSFENVIFKKIVKPGFAG